MKYHKLVNKGRTEFLDDIAKQEDKMFIRIFYNGKFVSYLFEPADVENLGLSNIFDMIDPDPDLVQAKANYAKLEEEMLEKKWATNKRKKVERAERKQAKLLAAQ